MTTGAVKGSNNFTFTYDDNGTRVTKTKNGVLTTYYYDGTKLIAEETSGNVTMYIYDAKGSPIGMQYRTSSYAKDVWDVYWFEKNLQGDIVAVYSYDGTLLISYKYDAWGNTTTTYSGSGASTTAVNNSITYRGYYYDKDLSMYYLQSRYYDPVVKRFINADNVMSGVNGSLHGYNLFAYCFNNPVNLTDSSGNWPAWCTAPIPRLIISEIFAKNHKENSDNREKIDTELQDSYTEEEAEDAIESYLAKYNKDEITITVNINDTRAKITNSYLVTSKYDRQYVSEILARTDGFNRKSSNLSAEWLGHNVLSRFNIRSHQTDDVDLEQNGDTDPFTKCITKLLELLGLE